MRKVLLALLLVVLAGSFAFAEEAAKKFESITLNVPIEKNQIMLYENIPFNSGKARKPDVHPDAGHSPARQ